MAAEREKVLIELLRRAIVDLIEPVGISHMSKGTWWREVADRFIREVAPVVFGKDEAVFGVVSPASLSASPSRDFSGLLTDLEIVGLIDSSYGLISDTCPFCAGEGGVHEILKREDGSVVRCQTGDVRALSLRLRQRASGQRVLGQGKDVEDGDGREGVPRGHGVSGLAGRRDRADDGVRRQDDEHDLPRSPSVDGATRSDVAEATAAAQVVIPPAREPDGPDVWLCLYMDVRAAHVHWSEAEYLACINAVLGRPYARTDEARYSPTAVRYSPTAALDRERRQVETLRKHLWSVITAADRTLAEAKGAIEDCRRGAYERGKQVDHFRAEYDAAQARESKLRGALERALPVLLHARDADHAYASAVKADHAYASAVEALAAAPPSPRVEPVTETASEGGRYGVWCWARWLDDPSSGCWVRNDDDPVRPRLKCAQHEAEMRAAKWNATDGDYRYEARPLPASATKEDK